MKKFLFYILFLCLPFLITGQPPRKEIRLPDLDGYHTLKGDFHMHTVFSDGDVWPTVRITEAWEEGLDVIAITDHLEYNPKKKYVQVDHNAGYDIAESLAERSGIILIHATEITKSMPPGHFNALFVKDAAQLFNDDYKKALEEAKKQDAFVLWNHPGWDRQAPDGPKWMDEHEALFKSKLFRGIEVANHSEWYPEVLDWALEKNLTVLSNSDMHGPSGQYKRDQNLPYRAMTLLFVKERSEQGVLEALQSGRTLGLFNNMLFGKKELAEGLFYKSIEISYPVFNTANAFYIRLENISDIPFNLQPEGTGEPIVIDPGYSVMINIPVRDGDTEAVVNYTVKNIFISSAINLPVSFSFKI